MKLHLWLALFPAYLTVPMAAFADPLDRIAEANEGIAAQAERFYLEKVPELDGKMPDYTWDAELRAATSCFVEGYRQQYGAAGLEDYIVALEGWAETEITSFEQLSFGMPSILSDPIPAQLSMDCGVMDISIERAEASGFIEMLSDPAVMARVMGN